MRTELIRIWFCDCGRVHVETRHCANHTRPLNFSIV